MLSKPSAKHKAEYPVYVNQHQHIADIRSIEHVNTVVSDIVVGEEYDDQHLQPYKDWDYSQEFIKDVSIDPDETMTKEWKNKFLNLCKEYSDIINYRPARYNGFYGDVNNAIDFASIPPPTTKIYTPKYSEDMNRILADKMDQLEKWHVLAKPETVGVIPKFVCPSLLVPKDDSNEWRLITNFTPLNKYIRKPPTCSPTIEETKIQIARFKYIATLDLANFYYQHGVKKVDMQYLATHHPYKGLRVYTCEPQGMRGVSEHSYERLGRVYGELCQAGRMSRQADRLYVGGETLQELTNPKSSVEVKVKS